MQLIWPMLLPVIVSRAFNVASSVYYLGVHYAIDIVRMWGYPTYLSPVIAPGNGIAFAAPSFDPYRGNVVEWRGPNQWRMQIAHLTDYTIPRGVWVQVTQGEVLGRVGQTGLATGPHEHIDWLNPVRMGIEAVWKAPFGAYAHDVSKWINVNIGWPTMPPPTLNEEGEMWYRKTNGEVFVVGPMGKKPVDDPNEYQFYEFHFGKSPVQLNNAQSAWIDGLDNVGMIFQWLNAINNAGMWSLFRNTTIDNRPTLPSIIKSIEQGHPIP